MRIALSAWLVVMAPCVALAQTPAPPAPPPPTLTQDIVVTATVAPLSLESLGRPVTVFTHDDLEQLGLSSIVDALRFAPGVDPRARGPRDVQTDIAVRGATFGQTLVLVDGMRINDSQSGHHNGDLPVAPSEIDRVEVVNGAGSTVHGADALGGTINVISRRAEHADGQFTTGQFGYVAGEGATSIGGKWAASGLASRSSGFMFDRDFAIGGAGVRGEVAPGVRVDVRGQKKAFGANGFYGNSPSKEWTDQVLASADWARQTNDWTTDLRVGWRNHGDHFRWDIARPGFAENDHRTNSIEVAVQAGRDLGGGRRVTLGGSTGGDSVRSSNLGDHAYGHNSLFGEVQWPVGRRTALQTGVRYDDYTTFGRSVSPALSFSSWVSDTVKLRAAAGHAFRIPTFTELYYHDPANLGSPDLRAEHGWSVDGGVDLQRGGWMASITPFVRWDSDVIDWTRQTPADLWRSGNVRDVTTRVVELSLMRHWRASLLRAYYNGQSVDAPALTMLSKYVLEYAPHSFGVSVAVPAGRLVQVALNADRRVRFDGQRYTLLGVRVSRALGPARVFVDAANLLNARYQEVAGVDMPGRWLTVGVSMR